MAHYTDFFVTDLSELRRAFVGWKRPAPERVQTERKNPFTGSIMMAPTWVADPSDTEIVQPLAGSTLGDRLASFPHLALNNVDMLKVADLMAIVLGDEAARWLDRLGNPPPLVPTEPSEGFLAELPAPFVSTAVAWSDATRRDVAAKWSHAIAESTGDEWSEDDCVQILKDLSALATKAEGAASGKHLYYWA